MITAKSNMLRIYQGFVTMGVAINVMGHGCIMGFPAILIPSLREPESDIHPTAAQESWIASVVGFALMLGNIIIVVILDQIGRKKTHLLTIPPVLTGWFLLIIANSVPALITARFLQGISMGMLGPSCSIIIGEAADPKNRGMFLTCISLSLTTGVLFCHALGTYFIWQTCAMICSMTAIASLALIIFTPESPSWLISKGRYDKAREVFLWLRGNSEEQKKELEAMITAHTLLTKSVINLGSVSIKSRIKHCYQRFIHPWHLPEFYKPIIIMIFLYTMFQFAGINVISSYAIDIIEAVVGPESNSSLLMVSFDVERLLCNILAIFLMKNLKRRTLLFSTGSACVLSYLAKATYVYLKEKNQVPDDSQWIPIALLTSYMFSLTVGITCLPFALSGELFPSQYRGMGGGLSILALSMNFFISVKSFPVLWDAVGLARTYVIYASVVTVCLCSLWFMLPETKDKTLQEIENSFKGRPIETTSSILQLHEDPKNEQNKDKV